jgi:predicted Rossmann fold flavoprotein
MSKILYDCIVVGGGAAGMMSAVTAARNGASVLLLEGTSKTGIKILQTGNGKCNFTNYNMSAEMFNSENKEFIANALAQFNQNDAIDFFRSIGVFPKEKNGYVYPHSETAASVREALINELFRLHVEVVTNEPAVSIEKRDEFTVNGTYKGKSLILAAGSKAAPKTGSDGSGYILAEKMGHTVVKPLPSLVQLVSDDKICKKMAGVRSTGSVSIHVDLDVYSDYGEIQYTDYGISGIPVFQISHQAVKGLDSGKKVFAEIDMIPDYSEDELMDYVTESVKTAPKNIDQLFSGILNKKLVLAVCEKKSIRADERITEKNIDLAGKAIAAMKNFKIRISGNKSFENAQVCQGGVALSEINPQTLESRILSGLYFAGEIMDVDGKCGGYNLQWAWTSGYIAGMNACRK